MKNKETLEEVAKKLKGKELFKESNDRARKILSEIKSLPIQETLEEVAEKYVNSFEFGIAHPRRVCKNAFINGAKWQIDKQDNFAVGFAEWSVARALGCDKFTINQDELNIYKKYIDTLNGN